MHEKIVDLDNNITALHSIISGLNKLEKLLSIPNMNESGELNQDARLLFIEQTNTLINSILAWWNLYIITKQHCDAEEIDFLAYIQVPYNAKHVETEIYMLERLKRNLITDYCFFLECLFGNIIFACLNKKNNNFQPNCKLLKSISLLTDADIERLTVLTSIRNCLHNNGIHKHSDFEVRIDGVNYKFLKGQCVEYGGWGYIISSIIESLRIVEKLLLHSNIKTITCIIDDYAFSQ